jgi:hypothetical protein
VPVGALAPPPLRAGPAAITPVSGVAATVAAITGAASLSGPTAPVTGPFAVVVTGRNIASVVFSVDGKRRATVHAKPGRKKFKLTINPRRQSHKVHRVTARVTYRAGSGSSSTTRRLVYRRADTSVHVPRFAG